MPSYLGIEGALGPLFFVGGDGMSLRKVGISGFRFFVARKKDVFEGDNLRRGPSGVAFLKTLVFLQ